MLKDTAAAHSARQLLNESVLFDRRIAIVPFSSHLVALQKPRYYWGWHASPDPDFDAIHLRTPKTQRPLDIFRPVREGRRIVVDFAHQYQKESGLAGTQALYEMFHNHDVLALPYVIFYTQKTNKQSRASVHVDFSAREDADQAILMYNKYRRHGVEYTVSK